jgi:GTP-binding protein
MIIRSAQFVKSSAKLSQCPEPSKPEFAFIGRSNVGKSSVINMLVNRRDLAKTSSKPGKTQLINHFLINDAWYLVDLPGYGFASVSQQTRANWTIMIEQYLLQRENLACVFVLLDSRHEPQASDLDFITWLGEKQVPLSLVFTKVDKLSKNQLFQSMARYQRELKKLWDDLPTITSTSAETKVGREELHTIIETAIQAYNQEG